ncbi:hypothetical protein MSI_03180 [Treponema sp. JC4]|uniref:hypothetical protein n=1 Tax=Treponema sp. JC4 TaxID=1124982 RepID=UPI00025B0484|nr:hypothetical protein [Treponema sp. JC4]EID85890.1 hypothetical protein MSI_03180 [Treponema sp. JC4]
MIKFRKNLVCTALLSAVLFAFTACANSSGSDDNGNYGYNYGNGNNETVVSLQDVSGMHTEDEKKQFIQANFNVSNEDDYYYNGFVNYYSESDVLKIPVITYKFNSSSYNYSGSSLKFKLEASSFQVYLYKGSSSSEWKTFDYKDILLADEMQACFGGNGEIPLFSGSDVKSFFVKEEFTDSYPSYDYDENGNWTSYYPKKFKYYCFAVKTSSNGSKVVFTAETDEFDEKTKFAVKRCKIQEGDSIDQYGDTSKVICYKASEYASYDFDLNNLYKWNVVDNSSLVTDQTYLDGTYTYESDSWYDYTDYSYKKATCTVTLNNGSISMTSNNSSNVPGFTGTYTINGSKITITAGSDTENFTYSVEGNKLSLSSNSYSDILREKFYSDSSYSLEMTKTSSSGSGSGGSGSGESVAANDIIGNWQYMAAGNREFEVQITADTIKKVAVNSNGSKGSGQAYNYTLSGSVMTINVNGTSGDINLSLSGDSLTLSAESGSDGWQILMGLFSTTDSSVTITKKN